MNIQSAKDTESWTLPEIIGMYCMVIPSGIPCWYDKETANYKRELTGKEALRKDFELYNAKPQIVPSEAGELWVEDMGKGGALNRKFFTSKKTGRIGSVGDLTLTCCSGDISIYGKRDWQKSIVHNQNGWERVFPVVQDDSVEEIVIENVMFQPGGGIVSCNEKSIGSLKSLFGRNIKTMKLYIPKEKA